MDNLFGATNNVNSSGEIVKRLDILRWERMGGRYGDKKEREEW
jgi:hypothetical protein